MQCGLWSAIGARIDCDEYWLVITSSSAIQTVIDLALFRPFCAAASSDRFGHPEVWGFYDEDDGAHLPGMTVLGNNPRSSTFRLHAGVVFPGPTACQRYRTMHSETLDSTDEVSLMHYGYADERDWQEKYERYTAARSLECSRGVNPRPHAPDGLRPGRSPT